MRDYHSHFESRGYYHIYNRGNNKENLFRSDENYVFFLKKWEFYLTPYLDALAYCLMPNHFHFIVRVKSQESFPAKVDTDPEINSFLENQFKRLLSSYTLSFNKYNERTGSLFQKRFKRVKVDSEQYLVTLIHYVHHNPIHHGFVSGYQDWDYSSFTSILSNKPTKILRDEVIDYFGGVGAFIKLHKEMLIYKTIENYIIE